MGDDSAGEVSTDDGAIIDGTATDDTVTDGVVTGGMLAPDDAPPPTAADCVAEPSTAVSAEPVVGDVSDDEGSAAGADDIGGELGSDAELGGGDADDTVLDDTVPDGAVEVVPTEQPVTAITAPVAAASAARRQIALTPFTLISSFDLDELTGSTVGGGSARWFPFGANAGTPCCSFGTGTGHAVSIPGGVDRSGAR